MTYEEYLQKEEELMKELVDKKRELMKEYVDSNNPYEVGDKVTDHIGTIIIESMGYSNGFNDKPCAIYFGIELNKNSTPNKKTKKRQVWQVNLI